MDWFSCLRRDIAPILEQESGRIRFRVDDVALGTKPPNTRPLASLLGERPGRPLDEIAPLLACSHDLDEEFLAPWGGPLLGAVAESFDEHRPLVLTPDAVWLTIAQGASRHVQLNAETLRSRLVHHEGKHTLRVECLRIPEQKEEWAEAIRIWSKKIVEQSDSDLATIIPCDFSTTTPTIRTASEIVLMEAFETYFVYEIIEICGIPEITLTGTVEDWENIRNRVRKVARYDLKWWTNRLIPICDGLIETAKGHPSLAFWRKIYKPKETYGAPITGWICDLFPYIKGYGAYVRNPLLEIPRLKIRKQDGLLRSVFPNPWSSAPIQMSVITDQDAGPIATIDLVGGGIGVRVVGENNTLIPEIGWFVRGETSLEKSSTILMERISAAHTTTPPLPLNQWPEVATYRLPPQLKALYRKLGSATFWEGTPREFLLFSLLDIQNAITLNIEPVAVFGKLRDGRVIGCTETRGSIHSGWLDTNESIPEPLSAFRNQGSLILKDTRIIATDFTEFLQCLLETGECHPFDVPGYYHPNVRESSGGN